MILNQETGVGTKTAKTTKEAKAALPSSTSSASLGGMVEFTKSMKFIVTFLISILLLGMFTNQKLTYNFLVLVLVSMIIINSDKVNSMIGGLKYNE